MVQMIRWQEGKQIPVQKNSVLIMDCVPIKLQALF